MAKSKPEKQVSDALARLGKKRSEIETRRKKKPQWRSSCRIELHGYPPVTIQVERSIPVLVLLIGTLKRFGEDLQHYGFESSWGGFPIADWISDLEKRVDWLRDDDDLAALIALEAKVKPLQTETQKREQEMDALASSLSDLLD